MKTGIGSMALDVGVIGFGAIGQSLVDVIGASDHVGRLVVVVRPGRAAAARARLADMPSRCCANVDVVESPEILFAPGFDVVVECAGHAGLAAFGQGVLTAGTDLVVASVGALADDALLETLRTAAAGSGAQIILPSGAIGGIDVLAAARRAGVDQVIYTGRKPPGAWAGSAAEQIVALDDLETPAVFFEGTARAAAQQFPKNANVAATLALAGIGMDRTQVRLIADPTATGNTHAYQVRSPVVDFTVELEGKATADNPRTSQSTVYSLARAVLNRAETIVI